MNIVAQNSPQKLFEILSVDFFTETSRTQDSIVDLTDKGVYPNFAAVEKSMLNGGLAL
jgi:hypothetical protein